MSNMQIIDRAMRLYKAHPVHRGTQALGWIQAPVTVRNEFADKARVSRTFSVEGRGEFPIDMLRYDECVPASDLDEKLIREEPSGRYRVELLTAKRTLTPDRWSSFGWTILSDESVLAASTTTHVKFQDRSARAAMLRQADMLSRLGPKLVAALEASRHTLHRDDESGPCQCSQCAFVRLRDEVLAEVKAAS